MEDYNRLISAHVLDNIEKGVLQSTPQPTMFGGKRMRKWVLPGSTDFDYPGTLSVGSLDGRAPDTLGGSFWKDFGKGFKQGFVGTIKTVGVPIAKEIIRAKLAGAGMDDECDYYSSSDEEMEGGMIISDDGIRMPYEMGLSRADGGEIEGGARMVKGSAEAKAWGARMKAMRAKKRAFGEMPGYEAMGGAYRPTGRSKPAGYIRRLVAERTKAPPFDIDMVGEPSENLVAYARANKAKGRKPKHATAEDAYKAKLESNKRKRAEKRAMAKMMAEMPFAGADAVGGALLMNHPGEFHSAHYPMALESYRHAYGAGIFDTIKKGAKAVAKSSVGKQLGKMAIDTAVKSASASGYVPPSVASAIGAEAKSRLAGAGVLDFAKKVAKSKIAKDLGKQAIGYAVKKASASGYVPPAIASALGDEAKARLAGAGVLDFAKKVAKSKIAKDLGKQAIGLAVKKASASGYVPPAIAEAVGAEAKARLAGAGVLDFAKKVAKSKIAKDLGKQAIGLAVKKASASGYVPPAIAEAVGAEAKKSLAGGARGARNAIVKQVMMETGLSLPMASKYVKEHGLY